MQTARTFAQITEAQMAARTTVKVIRVDARGHVNYQCLTCGKTIKFWGTIHNHMAGHNLPVITDVKV